MRRSRTTALWSLAVLLAVTACSGSPAAPKADSPTSRATSPPATSPPASSPPASSPPATVSAAAPECALITRAEAAAVLGSDPGPGYLDVTPGPHGDIRSCRYGPKDDGTPHSFLQIGRDAFGSVALAGRELDKQRAFYQRVMVDGAVSDVTGGFIVSDIVMNNNATIYFVRGTSVIRITATLAGATSPPRSVVEALAAKVTAARVTRAGAK